VTGTYSSKMGRLQVCLGAAMVAGALASLVGWAAPPAVKASATPSWAIKSVALPTNFTEKDTKLCEEEVASPRYGCDAYVVTVVNIGTAPSSGAIVVKDTLPPGIVFKNSSERTAEPGRRPVYCSEEVGASSVRCEYEGSEPPLPPDGTITIALEVTVSANAPSPATNRAEVEGGGASPVVTAEPSTVPNTVRGVTPPFGIQDFSASVFGSDGTPDMQAGDHPATVVTTINYPTVLNTTAKDFNTQAEFLTVQEPKTDIVNLPLGFVGDPLAATRCPESALVEIRENPGLCPSSQVGEVLVEEGISPARTPLYSVVPETGYPAEFGFEVVGTVVLLRARLLPTADGYVLSVSAPDIPRSTAAKVTGLTVMFFGDPTEHDAVGDGEALLSNPDACGSGSSDASVEADSWVDPGHWVSKDTPMYEASIGQGVTGCGDLQFEPQIEVAPEETQADTPSGYEIDLKVPQARDVPGILATPDLRNATVRLPEGVALSPAAADGLVGCKASGHEGIELGDDDVVAAENRVQEGEEMGPDGLVHPAAGHCPDASQIGEVEVSTPLLPQPLKGHVYLAAPACGGEGQPVCTPASATNGELYGIYIEAAGAGVIVKLKGTVSANPETGQLTTTFTDNPQLPFSELKLRFPGGSRAALANPQTCGAFATTSDLMPWSAPVTPDAMPISQFSIGCSPGLMAFSPSFSAHTLTASAASSSPFTTTFSRHDGEQDISGVSLTLPPGLVGLLSEIPLCEEPQAAAGECSEASKIGISTVAVGAGAAPFWIEGNVYLTGPYNGAPFGLSVVVPANAGPFNLGNVIVRAAIDVNPNTTAVTVTSGAFPQIVDGVPLRLQTVNVLVNRAGFMLDPTNCEQQVVTGKIAAAQGALSSVASQFAVEGCKSLAFKPSLTASTQGRASKADGASLDVKVTYPSSGEANIRSVRTELPRMLPSRLSTLQRACTAAVFEANPAKCPAESVVGIARASTAVLPVILTGPVYLVSHGGEKFPNVVVVLQGDGVRVDLVGNTDIKKGITSTTFASVPDDPVSSFELYLPEGKYSILGTDLPDTADYDLCGRKLAMPTVITAQNGAVIKQTTMIKVTGCRKVKKAIVKKKAKAKLAANMLKTNHGRGGK
jgi:hypothetical protein